MTTPVDLPRTEVARPQGPATEIERPGRRLGREGDPVTFDALVERAVAGRTGSGVGRLVRELPTGAAAEAWARWTRPNQALGMAAGTTAADLTGAAALGLGGLNGSGTATGSIGTGSIGAGATGVVFPQARNAGEAVVNAAADHLGVPYLWGGTDAENGFDCSGLIQDAYRRIGVELPKWSRHQATMGVEVPSIDQALPGDILTFGQPVNHVALYVGDGRMLHAPRTGEVVKIEEIDRPIGSIRRIVDPTGSAGAAGIDRFAGVAAPWTGGTLGGPAGSAGGLAADLPYRDLFQSAGQRWNVDPRLLAAVAKAESGFDPRAVSPVGAQGLMQFMPQTAAEMGVDPWDPASAIDGAARYLRESLDRFGSVEEAVASYNAGPGAVARYGGIPPFPETQNYVRAVLDAWRN